MQFILYIKCTNWTFDSTFWYVSFGDHYCYDLFACQIALALSVTNSLSHVTISNTLNFYLECLWHELNNKTIVITICTFSGMFSANILLTVTRRMLNSDDFFFCIRTSQSIFTKNILTKLKKKYFLNRKHLNINEIFYDSYL